MNGTSNTDGDNISHQHRQRSGQNPLIPIILSLGVFAIAYLLLEYTEIYQPIIGNPGNNGSFRKQQQSTEYCHDICSIRRRQRINQYNGRDILNRTDLLKQVSDAKGRLVAKLKVDYGSDNFIKMFTNEKDGSFVPFVPVSNESMTSLKRKLIMKVLKAQISLRQIEQNIHGCDCTKQQQDFETTTNNRILLNDNESPTIRDAVNRMESLEIEPTYYTKYIWATGGHSAAAGHGNLFNETYTAFLERDLKDIFGSIGIDFIARNYAMGGTASAAEIAMCWKEIFGTDVDFFSWDYGMTDAGEPWRVVHFAYQGAISPGRPAFLARRFERQLDERLNPLNDIGISTFYEDPNLLSIMRANIPDNMGLTTKEIKAMPEYVRNFKCTEVIEKGEPFCSDDKYSNYVCPDRVGKAPWHPGIKEHAMTGHSIALFLMDALIAALSDFAKTETESLEELLSKLDREDASIHDKIKQANLDEYAQKLYGTDNEEASELSGFNFSSFFTGGSICHTGRLPAEIRYQGYLTESSKKGGPAPFGQEEYDVGVELEEAMKLSRSDGDMMPLVWTDDKNREKHCQNITASPDYKDYFFTKDKFGWNQLVIPNQAERQAYQYDPDAIQGIVVVIFRDCDWGNCEEGFLTRDDLGSKWEMKINDERVVKLVSIRHDGLVAKNSKGWIFPPDTDGKYKVEIRVKELSHFVKISSFIIF